MGADHEADPDAVDVSGALAPGESALVLAPPFDDRADRICADLLTVAPPDEQRVLVVTVTETLGDAHRRWDRQVGTRPAEFAVVGVEFLEGGAAVGGDRGPDSGLDAGPEPGPDSGPETAPESAGWLTTLTVRDPGDLTGLGVRMSGQLGAWAGVDEQVVVCLRSLTTMLQYTDVEELVRFLQALEPHLVDAEAVSHFHLDPTAVDGATVRSLSHALDGVVEVSPDGVEVAEFG